MVPQGTVAFPDIISHAVPAKKMSGFVLPDGISASFVNWKVIVPNNLGPSPASAVVVFYQTNGAQGGTPTVNLALFNRLFVDDGESLNVIGTTDGPIDEDVPTTGQTMGKVEFTLGAQPTAEELIYGQLRRDPTNVNDDYTDDIQVFAMYLKIRRQLI